MAKVKDYHNAKRLKCGKIQERMYSVGPMIFCLACFNHEFFEDLDQVNYVVPYNDEDFGFIEKKKEKTIKHLAETEYKII